MVSPQTSYNIYMLWTCQTIWMQGRCGFHRWSFQMMAQPGRIFWCRGHYKRGCRIECGFYTCSLDWCQAWSKHLTTTLIGLFSNCTLCILLVFTVVFSIYRHFECFFREQRYLLWNVQILANFNSKLLQDYTARMSNMYYTLLLYIHTYTRATYVFVLGTFTRISHNV